MTTFLQFLCLRLLGPPSYDRGDGEAYWQCPSCGKEGKFHTLPHRPPYRDRFLCWSCNYRGDAADLLLLEWPDAGPNDRRGPLLDPYKAEYERWLADNPQGLPVAEPSGPAPSLSSPGTGGQAPDPRLPRRVAQAWAALSDEERELLGRAVHVALGGLRENPEALLSYAYSFWLWDHVARAAAARQPRTPAEVWEALRASRNGKPG